MLSRKKDGLEDEENLDRWLLTYADLITLLLAFFIVMYSISRVDSNKFGKISEAFTTTFKGYVDLNSELKQQLSSRFAINKHLKQGDLIVLKKQIDKISVQLGLGTSLITERLSHGLVIHISESALFAPAKAELTSRAKNILDLISLQLLKIPNNIRVEGHTDNLPINTDEFPTNWELSSARAINCLRYLIEKHDFPADRISALGYAEFRPIASNETAEGRAKNRRVDIVVLNLEESFIEPANLTSEPIEVPSDSVAQIDSSSIQISTDS